jgi:hypothetical protein
VKLDRRGRIALAGVLLAGVAGAFFFGSRSQAGAAPAVRLTPYSAQDSAADPMPSDTPPPAQAAAGWPFQQLPLVMKFDLRAPEITTPQFVMLTAPLRPVLEPVPVPVPTLPPSAPGQLSPWLLAPLAVGAGAGGADDVAGTVIPEPATVLLFGTGLALIGLGVRRRRPRWR